MEPMEVARTCAPAGTSYQQGLSGPRRSDRPPWGQDGANQNPAHAWSKGNLMQTTHNGAPPSCRCPLTSTQPSTHDAGSSGIRSPLSLHTVHEQRRTRSAGKSTLIKPNQVFVRAPSRLPWATNTVRQPHGAHRRPNNKHVPDGAKFTHAQRRTCCRASCGQQSLLLPP